MKTPHSVRHFKYLSKSSTSAVCLKIFVQIILCSADRVRAPVSKAVCNHSFISLEWDKANNDSVRVCTLVLWVAQNKWKNVKQIVAVIFFFWDSGNNCYLICTVPITWIKTSIFHSVVIIKILITEKKVVIDLWPTFSANIPLKSF